MPQKDEDEQDEPPPTPAKRKQPGPGIGKSGVRRLTEFRSISDENLEEAPGYSTG